MIWRHIENFSTNSLAFIASNDVYKESSYLRELQEFKQMR
jgi:hypothetical protein